MASRDYKSYLGQLLSGFSGSTKQTFRSSLDKKLHLVPIDLENLNATLQIISPDKITRFRADLLREIKSSLNIGATYTVSEFSKFSRPSEALKFYKYVKSSKSGSSILITTDAGEPAALLFSSYNTVSSSFFTPIINKLLSQYSSDGKGFDIGHLVSSESIAHSPLQLKLNEVKSIISEYSSGAGLDAITSTVANKILPIVIDGLGSTSNTTISFINNFLYDKVKPDGVIPPILANSDGNPDIKKVKSSILKTLRSKTKLGATNAYKKVSKTSEKYLKSIESKLDSISESLKNQSSYGSIVIQSDIIKTLTPSLKRLRVNVVIIQDREENQKIYGAQIEAKLNASFNSEVFKSILISEHFSPSFKEDIVDDITNTILGKPRKVTNSKKSVKTDNLNKLPKISLSNTSGESVSYQSGVFRDVIPPVRDFRGRFVSLIKIRDLINLQLHEVLRNNMTYPALRYRSGTFANSVKVTRLEQSGIGSLRAYYTYQKYPYQVFELGHAQGNTYRDPRALITKSIREIAQDLVTQRLKETIRE